VDYYPEHWPEDRWPIDAQLMAQAGMNVVRLGEFAWSKLEPADGQFDFAWLDRALEILFNQGLRAILGTPTASPPPWLMAAHPELFRVREDGLRLTYGNRREYCPNHPLYHDYTRRIVSQMAGHYAGHPAVIGWQIDNEFGDRCYCPVCAAAFRDWLRSRYGSLPALNEKWGTVFWSHIYNDWSEIPLPLSTGNSPNPGLALDFARFISDSYVAYQQLQVDLLREKCREVGSSRFITHNFMGFGYDRLDYFALARTLDFVSWDNYPRNQWWTDPVVEPAGPALGHANMYGLKRQNFWMMEQQAGPGGWEVVGMAPRPGELRLWAYQAIAHGADGMVFFRWRTARFGTEEYWHGLLNHDGSTSRRYAEIKRMGAEIRRAGKVLLGAQVKAKAAMLLSYDARFAFQVQANNPQFSYYQHFLSIFRILHRRNVPVEVVSPAADLAGLKLVIAPAFHVVSEAEAGNLQRFVQNGGVLLVTPRSGVKDPFNAVVNSPLPGLLGGVCGVEVEDYDSLMPGMSNEVAWDVPGREMAATPVDTWCDILRPTGAQEIACYRRDFYAGKPAVTLNRYGKGLAIYAGVLGSEAFYAALADWLLELAEVRPIMASPENVEVTERWQGENRLLFVLNHSDQEERIDLEETCTNLLDGAQVRAGKVVIPPREVLVLSKIT
jgi:beta-galactosidase